MAPPEVLENFYSVILKNNADAVKSYLIQLILPNSYDKDFNPKITRINSNGFATVDFGKNVVVPASYENFNNVVLTFTLISQK